MQKTISQFLDKEYKDYAMYVVENRALPSVIDGFKPTQRKVIYIANKKWKTGKEKDMKIFQLSGSIAADAHYHHGDSSLNGAIITMAQKFKNSMPLLDEIGQFGSLRSPESGAPRYISTKINENFRKLYKDFELLTPQFEEGDEIEPKYFLPIIPTVLLNGSSGIAVGFSTNILNRSPKQLIKACLAKLDGKRIPTLTPWINEYSGKFERDPDKVKNYNKWMMNGIIDIVNTTTIRVKELPPSMTYEKYESHLNQLIDKKIITDYEDNCQSNVDYTIKFRRDILKSLLDEGELKLLWRLKLTQSETENITVLDEYGKLKIFNKAEEIIEYFVNFRLEYYEKRKQYLIDKYEDRLNYLSNRAKFIKSIIDQVLIVNNTPKKKVEDQLSKNKFDKRDNTYNYLTSMPIHNLTKEKYNELLNEVKEVKTLLKETLKSKPEEMYRSDLLELEKSI
tara:strand:+ start:1142 stop:2494 length:1353 start_codon:yes stop_codon:yes gene_type:complete